MNKIFKVVWSKVKHCYVVVSEIAKNTTSGGARRCRMGKVSLAAAMAAAVLTGSFAMPNSAWAATYIPTQVSADQYIAVGTGYMGNPDSSKYELKALTVYDPSGNVLKDNGGNVVTKDYYVLKGYETKLYVERQQTILSDYTDVNGDKVGEYQYVIKEIMGGLNPTTAPNVLQTAQVVIYPTYHFNGIAARTVGGSTLNVPDVSSYAAASNSTWHQAFDDADFVIEDINGKWVNANSESPAVTNKSRKVQAEFDAATNKFKYLINGETRYANVENGYYLVSGINDSNPKPYVFLDSNGDLYTGTVYGSHNEILLTGVTDTGNLYTYWGTKNNDDSTLLSESKMTVGQLNKEFNVMAENDKKLAIEDIKRIAIDDNAKTISLLRTDNDSVAGTISIATDSTYDGTDGKDIRINISNHEVDTNTDGSVVENDTVKTISLDVGSKVVANRGAAYDANNNTLSTISINGNEYVIAATGGTGTMSSWTVGVWGKDNKETTAVIPNEGKLAFKGEGAAEVSLDGNTIIISATDTNRYTADVTASKSGDTVVTSYEQAGDDAADFTGINFKEGSNVSLGLEGKTITVNANNYYVTDVSTSKSQDNGVDVKISTNNPKQGYDEYNIGFVQGNDNVEIAVDENGKIKISTQDENNFTVAAEYDSNTKKINFYRDNNANKQNPDYFVELDNVATTGDITNLGNNGIKEIGIAKNTINLIRNDQSIVEGSLIFGTGGGKKEDGKYVDTYVTISQEDNLNAIKLSTGSKVEGAGVPVVGSTDKALSDITINGENFKVPVIEANKNTEGETPQYYLTSLKIDNTLYGIVSEGSKSDLSVTTSDAADGSYTANNGIVELKMVDNYTGQASNQKIVIKDVASKAVVDEILKVKFGVTDTTDKTIGLYKPNANGGVDTVLSDITVSSIVDNEGKGKDVQIQFGEGDNKFTVNAGSKVVANGGAYEENGSNVLTKLEVNGRPYDIVNTYTTGANVSASNNIATVGFVRNDTANGDNAYEIKFEAGSNVTIGSNGDDTITISVEDDAFVSKNNLTVAEKEVEGKQGIWTITDSSVTDGSKQSVFENTVLGDVTSTTDGTGYGKNYVITDTAGNSITLTDVASASKLKDVAGDVTNLNNSVTNILKGDALKFGVTDTTDKTIGLYKPNANGGVDTVLSDITVSSIVDNEGKGKDVQIQFGEGDNKFTVNAGSKVVANGGAYEENGSNVLTKLEVNGRPYDIVNTYTTGANVSASNNIATVGFVRNDTANGDNAYEIKFEAGSNVTIGSNGDDTITISVEDDAFVSKNNLTVAEKEVEGKQGIWTITDSSVTDGSKQSVFENTVLGDVTSTTDGTGYGKNYVITDTAGNSVTLTDVASASKLSEVDEKVTKIEGDITKVKNDITNIQGDITNINDRINTLETSSVINGYEIGYKYKDEQGNQIDAEGTIVLKHTDAQGNTNDIISIEGLQDTTLVAGDVTANETEFGRDYSFKDTKGNVVTLKDVASANTLKTVKEQVDKNTETLKEHTTTLESHTNTLKEHSEKIETNTKSIEKERLERIEMDEKIINYTERQVGAIDSKLNKVNSRVDKVGAGAAALAALHPMDFDPDDKLSFAVGAGNYAGETATALGAFYRPNEKVMMNVAGTYGNGENMVNMGVSFALDRTNNVSNSRTAMAREIVDLREQVATQGQQIAQLVALVNQLAGVKEPVAPTIQPFPDVPANHWAYEYVNNLIAMGVIEGYPDGTFGGDRTMTRYEFATMLFKAMQNGAVLSEQIRQEFNAELGRIRVDRIKGADDDANKIERVRVNNYEDRDDYGSKIVMVSAGK